MRLIQTLPVLGFALSASASDLIRRDNLHKAGLVLDAPVRRQVDVVSGVFTKISNDVTTLDTAVKSFSGDPSTLASVSSTLLSDIKSGTTTIQNSQQLDIIGATGIATSVTALNSTIATTINDIIAAKSALVSAGLGGVLYQNLVDQRAASQSLADATTSKTPPALQSVATSLSQGILDSLQRGITAYADQKGSTPPTGSSSTAVSSSVATPTTSSNGTAPTPTFKPTPSSHPSTTSAAPPSVYTGAANVRSPLAGFVVAVFGLAVVF